MQVLFVVYKARRRQKSLLSMKHNALNGYCIVDARLGDAGQMILDVKPESFRQRFGTFSGASGMFVSFEVNTGEQRRRVSPIKAN
ncbi:hypothetical protein [Bradyrhizobium sp. dw_411]|uniref:hypothetical protein n=1 Tax=Bradyrhizobium sp. dw_411 TaxID=2720082 RepID=UPI001BD08B38|nr:hypothetical protein [Bradyrhizobium sp. dw_411]